MLNREELESALKCKGDCYECKMPIPDEEFACEHLLAETAIAQQQEIDRLNKEMDDICTISARRLGQIAAMREALEQFKHDYEQGERMTGNYYGVCNILRSTDPVDYHNPADTERIENLEYTLIGVMHSVDKWFDEVDESTDEVNRAAQAREIALQAIEHLTAEKDELAGRLMRYDTVMKQTLGALYSAQSQYALPRHEADNKEFMETAIDEAIEAINALLGGGEG
jgi:chromosome segregation ATPase